MAQGIGLQTPIGQRVHRVTLARPPAPVSNDDGSYTYPEPWVALDPPSLLVRLRPATATDVERLRVGTTAAMATHVLSGPYHPQITSETRVTHAGTVYQVLGYGSSDARRADTECLLAAGVP